MLFGNYGVVAAIVLVMTARRLAKYVDKPLRETDARLSRSQKHIYFGADLIYFGITIGALFWYVAKHSKPSAWSFVAILLPILLVALYARADLIYGPKSRV